MKIEVKIPEVGESVNEALLTQWYRREGDFVRKGEILFLIETDKVTLEVVSEGEGILKILVPEGATVPVGAVVATLEPDKYFGKRRGKASYRGDGGNPRCCEAGGATGPFFRQGHATTRKECGSGSGAGSERAAAGRAERRALGQASRAGKRDRPHEGRGHGTRRAGH